MNKKIQIRIYRNIRKHMKQKKLTQIVAGERIGLTQSEFSNKLKRLKETTVTLTSLIEFSNALDIDIRELFD